MNQELEALILAFDAATKAPPDQAKRAWQRFSMLGLTTLYNAIPNIPGNSLRTWCVWLTNAG